MGIFHFLGVKIKNIWVATNQEISVPRDVFVSKTETQKRPFHPHPGNGPILKFRDPSCRPCDGSYLEEITLFWKENMHI